MRNIIYILLILLLSSCVSKKYTITDTRMIKESRIINVKEFRAKRIIKKFEKIGVEKPKYRGGEMELYFEHIHYTIRFRPKEIKQLQK